MAWRFILLLLFLLRSSSCTNETPVRECGVSVVLFGSTGDLARRYIWPAIFENFIDKQAPILQVCTLVVYGATRKPVTSEDDVWSTVASNVKCAGLNSVDESACTELKSEFRKHTHFIHIKSPEHYQELSDILLEYYRERNVVEVGRIFYLSVPPFAYAEIVENIHLFARPKDGWVRVVLEKPFGHNLSSARALADELSQYLAEGEVYRVDHYLGKLGVQQILPFREHNYWQLLPLWNGAQIQYVEIAMKERLDVKGRARFYDNYGIIRDVMQNHLTEILVQIAMDLEKGLSSYQDYLTAKSSLLSKVYPPRISQALLGQYSDYQKHLQDDGVIANPGNISTTPTYSCVALFLKDPKWNMVPFILTSGKQLDERTSYARVVFKESSFSLEGKDWCTPEIIFLIQDETLQKPGILISSHFSHLTFDPPFSSWVNKVVTYPNPHSSSNCQYTFLHPEIYKSSNAYTSLFAAILDGKRDLFVDTKSLMESWRIWTPLLEEIQLTKPTLHTYSPTSLEALDFQLRGTKVVPTVTHDIDSLNIPVAQAAPTSSFTVLLGVQTFVRNRFELASLLAEDVYTTAVHSVQEKGSFHIALPGGRSLLLLFQTLVLEYQHKFPWYATHIWQTDERCVKQNEADSNLNLLTQELLSLVPVPHHQVHVMPVHLHRGICAKEDRGEVLYEKLLNEETVDGRLDYVVLGVGSDGHIASLFPEQAVSNRKGNRVAMVTVKDSYSTSVIRTRMSLNYKTLAFGRKISLVVVGEEKEEIFHRLRSCWELREQLGGGHVQDCDLPAVKLMQSVEPGQLSLYVESKLIAGM